MTTEPVKEAFFFDLFEPVFLGGDVRFDFEDFDFFLAKVNLQKLKPSRQI